MASPCSALLSWAPASRASDRLVARRLPQLLRARAPSSGGSGGGGGGERPSKPPPTVSPEQWRDLAQLLMEENALLKTELARVYALLPAPMPEETSDAIAAAAAPARPPPRLSVDPPAPAATQAGIRWPTPKEEPPFWKRSRRDVPSAPPAPMMGDNLPKLHIVHLTAEVCPPGASSPPFGESPSPLGAARKDSHLLVGEPGGRGRHSRVLAPPPPPPLSACDRLAASSDFH